MKASLTWKIPKRVVADMRPRQVRACLAMVLRWIVLGVGTGALLVWCMHRWMPNLGPPHLWQIMWWALAGYTGLFMMYPVIVWIDLRCTSPGYLISKHGLGSGDSRRGWQTFAAFDIQQHSTVPDADVIIFYSKSGRHQTYTLPDDDRTRRLILRYVSRQLPELDACDQREDIVQPYQDIPGWLKVVMALCAIGYAGLAAWLLHPHIHSGSAWEIWSLLAVAINPASWLGVWWHKRHKRTSAMGWAMAFGMTTMLLLMTLIVYFRL